MMLGSSFRDLSDAERRISDAFPTGQLVDFGTGEAADDNPASGKGWGPARQVRAEVLAALLCGALEAEPGHAGEVSLKRASVTGKLEVPGVTFKHRLRLTECCVADGIDLSQAVTQTLDLRSCHVGAIRLHGAKINGVFTLSGGHLDGGDKPALVAAELTVTGDMCFAQPRRIPEHSQRWRQRHLRGLGATESTQRPFLSASDPQPWLL